MAFSAVFSLRRAVFALVPLFGVPFFGLIAALPALAQSSPQAAAAKPEADKPAVDTSTDALRKAAQNPVADMISLPFQNNTNFNVGPYNKPQNVLNIQPVVPFKLNQEWNLITRWVTPVIYQPRLSPSDGAQFGLGNLQPSFFLSPAKVDRFVWGVGPVLWLPTATASTLGVNKWGAGPSAVALYLGEKWVFGALVNNIWAGTQGQRVNQMLIQPFVNYNLPDGWYLTTSPVVTANWLAKTNSDIWTVPIGGGVGRLFKIDKLPINAQVQAFYNVVKPEGGGDWTFRFQLQALFPTF